MTEYALLGVNACDGETGHPRMRYATTVGSQYATNLEGRLGVRRVDDVGNVWVWCKAEGAIAQGNPVYSPSLESAGGGSGDTGTVDTAIASGASILTDAGAFATVATYDDVGWFVGITGTTVAGGEGQVHQVEKALSTSTIKIRGTWAVGLYNGTATFQTFSPWSVDVSATTTKMVIGVAQHAVAAATPYFWAQAKGVGVVKVDYSETALIAGSRLIQSTAAAGMVEGVTATSTTTTATNTTALGELQRTIVGMALYPVTAADGVTPAIINCDLR